MKELTRIIPAHDKAESLRSSVPEKIRFCSRKDHGLDIAAA